MERSHEREQERRRDVGIVAVNEIRCDARYHRLVLAQAHDRIATALKKTLHQAEGLIVPCVGALRRLKSEGYADILAREKLGDTFF